MSAAPIPTRGKEASRSAAGRRGQRRTGSGYPGVRRAAPRRPRARHDDDDRKGQTAARNRTSTAPAPRGPRDGLARAHAHAQRKAPTGTARATQPTTPPPIPCDASAPSCGRLSSARVNAEPVALPWPVARPPCPVALPTAIVGAGRASQKPITFAAATCQARRFLLGNGFRRYLLLPPACGLPLVSGRPCTAGPTPARRLSTLRPLPAARASFPTASADSLRSLPIRPWPGPR